MRNKYLLLIGMIYFLTQCRTNNYTSNLQTQEAILATHQDTTLLTLNGSLFYCKPEKPTTGDIILSILTFTVLNLKNNGIYVRDPVKLLVMPTRLKLNFKDKNSQETCYGYNVPDNIAFGSVHEITFDRIATSDIEMKIVLKERMSDSWTPERYPLFHMTHNKIELKKLVNTLSDIKKNCNYDYKITISKSLSRAIDKSLK